MAHLNLTSDPVKVPQSEQTAAQTQIAVCIPTYRQPDGLRRLLAAIDLQEPLRFCQITIVVVDNEDSAQTREICEEFASKSIYPVRYGYEEKPGLPHVRNKAVQIARVFADAIAFVDDDEVPSPGWLKYLAACLKSYGADAVAGPVVPSFMGKVPRWVRAGRFFEGPRYMTGTKVPEALTRNALIRTDVLDRIGLFDARFAATGNDDWDLFARLHESGGTICWSDEAVVEESVPTSHTTVGYILRGAYRKANANAIRTSRSRVSSLMQVGGGLLLSTKGIYLLIASMTRGKVEVVKALQRIWSGAGTMAGALVQRDGQFQTIHSA